MNSDLFVVRPRWTTVARIVSERLGKTYAGNYVLQIASGTRSNAQVAEILKELGVMRSQLEAPGKTVVAA